MEHHLPFQLQLKYEREKRGWSQADLAEKVQSDFKTVYRWEAGKSVPHPFHRQKICELFGISAEELGLIAFGKGRESAVPATNREDWGEAPLLPNAPVSPRQALKDRAIGMTQKKLGNVLIVGRDLLDEGQELGNQGQSQARFGARGDLGGLHLWLMQRFNDPARRLLGSWVLGLLEDKSKCTLAFALSREGLQIVYWIREKAQHLVHEHFCFFSLK